jgi:hypothetical protein
VVMQSAEDVGRCEVRRERGSGVVVVLSERHGDPGIVNCWICAGVLVEEGGVRPLGVENERGSGKKLGG